MLRIRLQRFGKKDAPRYRVAVMEKASKRDGEPVENLGFYNPKTKELVINLERANYWKSVGAIPTETVSFLLSKTPAHDLANGPYKFVSKTRKEKEKHKEEILAVSRKRAKAKKKKEKEAPEQNSEKIV